MYYVYALRSKNSRNLFVGSTQNVEQRLKQHNAGIVRLTAGKGPFTVVYTEEHPRKQDAFDKERYYRSPKGKAELSAKIK